MEEFVKSCIHEEFSRSFPASIGNDSLFLNAFKRNHWLFHLERVSYFDFWWKHLALCTWSIKNWARPAPRVCNSCDFIPLGFKAPFLQLLLCGSLVIVFVPFISSQCYKFSYYIWSHFSPRKAESLTNSHGLQGCRNYGILIRAKYKQQN